MRFLSAQIVQKCHIGSLAICGVCICQEDKCTAHKAAASGNSNYNRCFIIFGLYYDRAVNVGFGACASCVLCVCSRVGVLSVSVD